MIKNKSLLVAMAATLCLSSPFSLANDLDINEFKKLKPLDSKAFNIIDIEKVGSQYMVTADMEYAGQHKIIDLFVSEDKRFVMFGNAFNTENGRQYYSKHRLKIQQEEKAKKRKGLEYTYDPAPLKKLSVFTLGNGSEDYYLFTDFDCPFCQEVEKRLGELKGSVKLHILPYPIERLHPRSKGKILSFMEMSESEQGNIIKAHGLSAIKDDEGKHKIETEKKLEEIMGKFRDLSKIIADSNPEFRGLGTPTVINSSGMKVSVDELFKGK